MIESILAVSPYAPWPMRDGATLRTASLLEGLANEVRHITLISPSMPPGWQLPPPLKGRIHLVACETAPVRQGSPLRFLGMDVWPFPNDPGAVAAALGRELATRRFDALIAWPGLDPAVLARAPGIACLDMIDCHSLSSWRQLSAPGPLAARWGALREAFNYWAYERYTLSHYRLISVVGPRDAAALQRAGRRARIAVVPNGVDAEYFRPLPVAKASEPTVVFSGTMGYPPNADAACWLATVVWPRVRRQVTDARLLLVGARPGPRVRALESDPSVTVTGRVEDIREPLSRAWVAVAPMRTGAGIKNKVLEAWAVGLPVVGTSLAFNGLESAADEVGVIVETEVELAEALIALLRDSERRAALGARGRGIVHDGHTWGRAARQLLSELAASMAQAGVSP